MTPFGKYLEQLRRSRGLQQSQLAADVGIQSCYVSAMENGRKGPASPDILRRFIRTLELTPVEEQQFWASVTQSKMSRKVPPGTSSDEYRLIDEFWSRLGTLTENQIQLISLALKSTEEGGRRYREI